MIEWKRSLGLFVALAGFAAACGGSSTPTTASAVTPVSSLAVTGTPPSVSTGATSQFKAIATMSDGTTQDVTSTAVWSSSNLADATVSATGLVTAVAPGTVSILATYQSVTASDQIAIGS